MTEKTFGIEDILAVMVQINNALRSMREYLLSEDNLIIGEDSIFVDRLNNSLKFCAYPQDAKKYSRGFKALLEKLLLRVDTDDAEGVKFSVRLFKSASNPSFRIYDVIEASIRRTERENGGTLANAISKPIVTSPSIPMTTVKPVVSSKAATLSKLSMLSKSAPLLKAAFSKSPLLNKKVESENAPPETSEEETHEPDINIMDLDDMDIDEFEDLEEEEEHSKSRSKKRNSAYSHIIIPQAFLLAAMLALYMIRGLQACIRIFPLYLIFAVALLVCMKLLGRSKKKNSTILSDTAEQDS